MTLEEKEKLYPAIECIKNFCDTQKICDNCPLFSADKEECLFSLTPYALTPDMWDKILYELKGGDQE